MTDYNKTIRMAEFGVVALNIKMPCGTRGEVDISGGYPAYRCTHCNAINGSIGMPRECYDLYQQEYKEKHGEQ